MRTFIIAFILSLLSSLLLTPRLRDWAVRLNWVDEVGGRKIHTQPIPRVGGISILISTLVPLLALSLWNNDISRSFWGDSELLIGLAGGLSIIAMIGIVDDLKGVSAIVKLSAQIAAASIAYWAGIHIDVLGLPFVGLVSLGWFSYGVTVFWFVLAINAINLIDGMDGLAGSVVSLAAGTLFLMCLIEDKAVACLILISMLGGLGGFLRFNINPASIFLGDTGSMSLGFILSVISVHFTQKSSAVFSLVAALLILGLPIFDLGMAIVRRALAGKRIFSADQYHIHHILLRKGYSQNQSVLLLAIGAIAFETLAFAHIYIGDKLDAVVLLAVMVGLGLAIRGLGYHKIIFNQRRNTVMEKVQAEGLEALAKMTRLTTELVQLEESTKAVELLNAMAQEMRWDIDVYKGDTSILAISCVSRSGQDHLQGIQTDSIQLAVDLRVEVSWLEEEGVLDVLERSFVQLLLLALKQSVLVAFWSKNQAKETRGLG
jgi:UDP-GlcNAc:undecaprenyl-phosphate/decaprenyl-phosphate GlcNAc-1-phosphate transferase